MLVLCALGLLIAGITAYALERRKVDTRIDDSLSRSVTSFRDLAAAGRDPESGEPFASAAALVHVAIQRSIPARTEGMLGYAQGAVRWYAPSAVRVRLEDDPELVRQIDAVQADPSVMIRTATTSRAEYRYVVVPVVLGPDDSGALVLAFDRSAELDALGDTFRTYAAVAVVSLVLIGIAGWLVAGRFLAPIRRLRDTARTVSESDLTARIPVRGNDDLSDLTRTFNDMVERLEASFVSQRRLLDDVSHELRTPLTIVAGHLEVMDPADPEDVVSTREIAFDEIARMDRLVHDLMTLATADRPDFVRRERTHLGRLTDDVLDKARALGARRWVVEARAEAVLDVDPQRITQAWLQLASNAVRHSSEGSRIGLGSSLDGDTARFWVRDEGVGVPPDEVGRIFDRFSRGTSAPGAGRTGGAGLGLAIVAAIASAHGGTASVRSTEGKGSTFTITVRAPQPVGTERTRGTDEQDPDR